MSQVTVVTGQITINDGGSFLLTAADGSIDDRRAQGLFVRDTRLISYYEISLDRQPLTPIASSAITHRVARYEFTNPELETAIGIVPAKKLLITVRRDIIGGMHEDIDITNHHQACVDMQLMLAIRSDFVDVFRVKAQKLMITEGRMETTWSGGTLTNLYRNGDFTRGVRIRPEGASSPPRYSNGRLVFDIVLDPGETWHTCIDFIALVDGEELEPKHTDAAIDVTPAGQEMANFLKVATHLHSSNRSVEQAYHQALVDLAALRIPVDHGSLVWIPAAGIPWFVAVFGRDPLIASLQTMAIAPGLAKGTLLKLAELQATEEDDWRDAAPGKILHELRQGELAQLGKVPSAPYYGAIDTTMLWIITLSETYRWTGDRSLLDDCYAPLEKALTWIEQYGDFDGDGFVEYCSRSTDGIQNQGWKDSGDAIRDAAGEIVEAPIALCETQGQVYDAWRRAAALYDVWGESDRAQALRQKADELYQRFNERFWMEDEGFYCLGLDGNKEQIRSIASNAGQLLWSGIVPADRAEQIAKRLFQPDLWCGWGIRTLSAENPAYDPIGYHTGSVWAHDNAFIAAGLKRYGYHAEANRIAEGIFAAASQFQSHQMPELFGGIERQPESFPVPYVDANIPQAWAAGAMLWLVSSMLGFEADASNHQLYVQPFLPSWLPDVQLTNVAVGEATVNLRFWREDEQTKWEVTQQNGEVTVSARDRASSNF